MSTTHQADLDELLERSHRAGLVEGISRGLAHDATNLAHTFQLARQVNDPRARTQLLEEIGKNLNSTAELIAGIGRSEPRAAEPLVLADILAEVDAWQKCQARIGRVRVHVHARPGLPAVRGDWSAYRDALLAVLTNAKEAVQETRGVVQVDMRVSPEGVVIAIADDGPGLRDDAVVSAFEPFFTTREGHLGIGLTVARKLCERYGGSLRLADPGPRTTRFEATLPLWKASQAT